MLQYMKTPHIYIVLAHEVKLLQELQGGIDYRDRKGVFSKIIYSFL